MIDPQSFLISSLAILLALLLATIWHELGHLLIARLYRIPVKLVAIGLGPALWRRTLGDVRLELRAVPLGMAIGVVGRRTSDGHARRPASHDIAVAAAGPLASFLLGGLLIGLIFLLRPLIPLGPDMHPVQAWLAGTALLSAFLGLMNLAPIPGLDGGHLAMLAMALCGWQFSPQREVAVMRLGVRLTTALCVLGAAYSIIVRVA